MALTLTNTFLQTRVSPSTTTLTSKVRVGGVKVGNARTPQWSCRKKEIHPEFHEDAKVYCNNELVLTTGGTQKEYVVDVWSGNHPFYLGNRSGVLNDADQVEKFRKKYGGFGGLDSKLMEIPNLKGEIILPSKKKAPGKGKKK